MKRSKVLLVLATSVLLVERLLWLATPNIWIIPDNLSWKLSLINVFHGILLLSKPVLIMLMGYLLANGQNYFDKAVKFWRYIFILGCSVMVIYFLIQKDISAGRIYNSLLPLLRNSYPLASGVIFALVTMPYISVWLKKSPKVAYVFLGGVFLLPTIFERDIFGMGTGDSVMAGVFLFYLGALLAIKPLKITKAKRIWLSVLVLGLDIFLWAMMPAFSQLAHGDLSTMGRFFNSTSFLNVLLVSLLFFNEKKATSKVNNGFIYLGLGVLVISYFDEVLGAVNSFNEKFVKVIGYSLEHLSVVAIVEVALIIAVLALFNFILNRVTKVKQQKIEHDFPAFDIKQGDQWLTERVRLFKKSFYPKVPQITAVVIFYLLAYLSFVLMNLAGQAGTNTKSLLNCIVEPLSTRQPMILMTTLILFMMFRLFWALLGRFWFAEIITLSIAVIWPIANYLKIKSRNEPILPPEFTMYKAWGSLLGMVATWIVVVTVIALIAVFILAFYLKKKHPVKKNTLIDRLIWLVVSLVFFSGSFYVNHTDSYPQALMDKLEDYAAFYNQLEGAQNNGPFVQFINNLDVKIMEKPKGYSKEKIEVIVKKYRKKAQNMNQTRTNNLDDQIVIFTLSESFADPARVPGVKLPKDPIPYIKQLKEETTSGLMLSTGYGGGTANMEYMTLTGLNIANFSPTLQVPYTQLVPRQKYAPNFTQYFPEAVAIHPYISAYYSREQVYEKFGFDSFMYLDSKYPIKHQKTIDNNSYMSDETAFENTLDQVKAAKSGLFVNLVTMQNHMPYSGDAYNDSDDFKPTGKAVQDEEVNNNVKGFTAGLYYTDKAVKMFIKQLDKIDKPITLVLYGDHLPGIYSSVDMKKNNVVLHETDYFIYSNRYAKEHGAKRITKKTALVAPNDFLALATAQTNSKVSPYLALLSDVQSKLPVLTIDSTKEDTTTSSELKLVSEDGKTVSTKDLTKEQKEILEDYKLIQYDITAGKQYVKQTDLNKIAK